MAAKAPLVQVRSLEGPTFVLFEDDDMEDVRKLLTAVDVSDAYLPLDLILGLSSPEVELVKLADDIEQILKELPEAGDHEAEEVIELVGTLRAKAGASRLLEGLIINLAEAQEEDDDGTGTDGPNGSAGPEPPAVDGDLVVLEETLAG